MINPHHSIHAVPQRVWDLIEAVAREPRAVDEILARLSEVDLVELDWSLEQLAADISTPHHFEEPDAVSEDTCSDVASWAVTQGRAFYEDVVWGRRKLPSDVPATGSVKYLRSHVIGYFMKRFGTEPPFLDTDRDLGDVLAELRMEPPAMRSSAGLVKLVRVGFFRDMPHAEPSDPSLASARHPSPHPDEAALAQYLEKGHVYIATPAIVNDALDPAVTIGPAHYLTDGVYVWPADLAHYVRRYHVRLPPTFVEHARSLGFAPPASVDLTALSL